MQDMLESCSGYGCQKLDYTDDYGYTLYKAIKPLPEGNLTVGLYYNEQCTVDSGLLWSDYIMIYYKQRYANYYYYYNYADKAKNAARNFYSNNILWNSAMAVYKICQPCRAYNLNNDESGSGSQDRRQLNNDENDGEGDAEQWGYDCDDDAGYTNCNQVREKQTDNPSPTRLLRFVLMYHFSLLCRLFSATNSKQKPTWNLP